MICAVVTKKWLVAPESSIAQSLIDFMLMSTVGKIVLAAQLPRVLLVFFVVVVFVAACVFLMIHAYRLSHPAVGFGVPTSLGVLFLGILWRFWGIM